MPVQEIVTVQRALFPPGRREVLVYARDRRRIVEQEVPRRVLDALGGDAKGFFFAEWDAGAGEWRVGGRTQGQDW